MMLINLFFILFAHIDLLSEPTILLLLLYLYALIHILIPPIFLTFIYIYKLFYHYLYFVIYYPLILFYVLIMFKSKKESNYLDD